MKSSSKTNSVCDVLNKYIKKKIEAKSEVTYSDCLYYLNNKTNLSQIDIYTCLNNHFPQNKIKTCINWIGIV